MRYILAATCLWLAATGAQAAEGELRWEPTLDAAKRMGAQTNRFVLVHFWAPWCKPCLRLDSEVLSKAELGADLSESFVAVKLNADNFPATARQYGVTSLPADIVLSPSGQPVARLSCPADYAQYVGQLRQVAANAAGRVDSPYADLNVPATAAAAPAAPRMSSAFEQAPSTVAATAPEVHTAAPTAPATPAVDPSSPYANVFKGQAAPANLSISPATTPTMRVSEPAPAAAPPQVAVAPQPASNPPLGLDGFCPVELVEHKRWVKGDARWGAIHNGRTYLFSGPEQQQKFLPNGDAYAPVMSGGDPVVALDHNQQVEGKREFGMFFNRRIYLFADPGSRDRFLRSPERYNVDTLQARRTTPGQSISR
jgi:protein disulfide-isomerase